MNNPDDEKITVKVHFIGLIIKITGIDQIDMTVDQNPIKAIQEISSFIQKRQNDILFTILINGIPYSRVTDTLNEYKLKNGDQIKILPVILGG